MIEQRTFARRRAHFHLQYILLGVVCMCRPNSSDQAACPPKSTRALKTATTMYCVCIPPLVCAGPACKSAKRAGKVMHGYPAECGSSCVCQSAVMVVVPTTSQVVDTPLRPRELRAIFIKSYKVASTTVATVFQRLTEERGLRSATRYNAGVPLHPSGKGAYHIIYGHNFYTMGTRGGYPCKVKRATDGTWTHCGGYQSWMDYYIEDAFHLIMVAEPIERVASMYYYEAGYTKQRDRGPADTSYARINSEARFEDPSGADDEYIAYFLKDSEYYNKWERVQWWWVREATTNMTLEESIQLLRDRFLVGLPNRLDETLLIWKSEMGLETRDIVYTSMKASLSHPRTAAWSAANLQRARDVVESNGDLDYYNAATEIFEAQATRYGLAALAEDAQRFALLLAKLRGMCSELAVETEQLHVPDQVYCMLAHYDRAYENEVQVAEPLGCFSSLQGSGGRLGQMLFSAELTLSACLRRCRKGTDKVTFDLFALAYGTHCYCGHGDPPQSEARVADSLCDTPCGGNGRKMCGGTTGYAFYRAAPRGDNWTDPIISGHTLDVTDR